VGDLGAPAADDPYPDPPGSAEEADLVGAEVVAEAIAFVLRESLRLEPPVELS